MSLVKLLAVGRSLGAVNNNQSRYRMRWANPLPKFGARKESGESEKAGKQESEQPLLAPSVSATLSNMPAGSGGTLPSRDSEPKTVFSGKSYPEHSIAPVLNRQSSSGTRLWNPWAVLRSRLTRRRPTRGAGEPVQGELELDMVRPVRNDLSDTDLEIVTRRVPSVGMIAPPMDSRVKLAWARITRLGPDKRDTVSRP